MKLFTAVGPSARTVRMLLAEKNLKIPMQEVDIIEGENLSKTHRAFNPGGQLPVLELDSGFILSESLAICEYIDDLHPAPPLIGSNEQQRAETHMWCRRIDLRVMEPMIQGFRGSDAYEFFKDRYHLVVDGANDLKIIANNNLAWLDEMMAGKTYICSERFSLADIQLFCFLDYCEGVGMALKPEWSNLQRWFSRIQGRPSVENSRHRTE
jgi:glutathione S-transferase